MGNRRANERNSEDTVRDYAEFVMELPGLFAFLLMVLEWPRPGLPAPQRPICDLRVLDRVIKEAQDTEAAMRLCREGCGHVSPVTVPQTRVDIDVWERKNALDQAAEVQSGLWLLNQAVGSLKASVSNTALLSHIEENLRSLLSIGQVLRRLNVQEFTPPAHVTGSEGTWRVSSASELLQVHTNFLRGKVRLLLSSAPACHQDAS